MTDTPSKTKTTRRPDCVTEIRMGNTILTVSGYFKRDTTDTAARIPLHTFVATKWRKSWRPRAAARPTTVCDLLPVVPR